MTELLIASVALVAVYGLMIRGLSRLAALNRTAEDRCGPPPLERFPGD